LFGTGARPDSAEAQREAVHVCVDGERGNVRVEEPDARRGCEANTGQRNEQLDRAAAHAMHIRDTELTVSVGECPQHRLNALCFDDREPACGPC
jgi:hypothetical protein